MAVIERLPGEEHHSPHAWPGSLLTAARPLMAPAEPLNPEVKAPRGEGSSTFGGI